MNKTLLKPPDHRIFWLDLASDDPTGFRTIISHLITTITRGLLVLIVLLFSAALLPTWLFIGLLASTTIVVAAFFHRKRKSRGPFQADCLLLIGTPSQLNAVRQLLLGSNLAD